MNSLTKLGQGAGKDQRLIDLSRTLSKINLLTERQAFQLKHLQDQMSSEKRIQLRNAYQKNLELRQFVLDQFVDIKIETVLFQLRG